MADSDPQDTDVSDTGREDLEEYELDMDDLADEDCADDQLDDDDLARRGASESVDVRLARMPDLGSSLIELEKIPRRLWRQTLAPFRRQQRTWIALRVPDEALRDVAMQLADEMADAELDARVARDRAGHAALRTGHPLPSPDPRHAAATPSIQVNIRLRRDDHERLTQAAAAVGLKPTTLARALVLNGAAMILREHGREHLAPPPRPIYTPLSLD